MEGNVPDLGVLHALDRPMRNLQMIAADAVLSVGAEAGLLGGCGAATEIFTRAGRNICRWLKRIALELDPRTEASQPRRLPSGEGASSPQEWRPRLPP